MEGGEEEKGVFLGLWGCGGGEECFMFEDCGLFELTFAEEISSWHLVSFSIFSREGPALNMPRETACLKRGEGRGGGGDLLGRGRGSGTLVEIDFVTIDRETAYKSMSHRGPVINSLSFPADDRFQPIVTEGERNLCSLLHKPTRAGPDDG